MTRWLWQQICERSRGRSLHIASIRLESIRLANEANAEGVGVVGGGAGVAAVAAMPRTSRHSNAPSKCWIKHQKCKEKNVDDVVEPWHWHWHWQSKAMAIGLSNAPWPCIELSSLRCRSGHQPHNGRNWKRHSMRPTEHTTVPPKRQWMPAIKNSQLERV